jgi:hypothetical protein
MDINLSSINPVNLITSNFIPIAVFFLGSGILGAIITIVLENRYKKLNSIEEKLREDRRKIYFDLLEPFVKLFNKETNKEEAVAYLSSEKYRRTSFEVTLIGSDEVVAAYGDLMQETFKQGKEPSHQNYNNGLNPMIVLLANLLLQLRKDLEHKNTKLTKKDMLRHMITDIDNYKF